jgi:endonuclease YncB( thermonuclease family)
MRTKQNHRPGTHGRALGATRRAIAKSTVALWAALAVPVGAAPYEILNGPVEARVLRVLDGDTVEVAARIWLEQELTVRVRLFGIDAPELRSGCARERAFAARARDMIAKLADGGVRLTRIHYDKYGGRVLAKVAASDGRDLSEALLAAGLAQRYRGGRKRPWCETVER